MRARTKTAFAVVLRAFDFAHVLVFVLVFETFFPMFQNRSATLATLPVGIVLLALLLASAVWSRSNAAERSRSGWTLIDSAIGVFFVVCIAGTSNNWDPRVAVGGLRDELKYFVVYASVRCAAPSLSAAKADRIARALLWLVLVVVAVGVLQHFVGYGSLAEFANLPPRFAEQYMGLGQYSPDGGQHLLSRPSRVYSVLASPLYTGYAAMGGMLFAAVLYEYRALSRLVAALFFELCGLCLFLTYTRSAMVGAFAGLFVLVVLFLVRADSSRTDKARFVLSLAGALVLLAAVLNAVDPQLLEYPLTVFSHDASVTNDHYEYMLKDVEFLLANPLGAGTGRSSMALFQNPTLLRMWTESWYFYIAAELGFPGLAVYLTICALVLRRLIRAMRLDRKGGKEGWRTLGTALWFVAMLAAGIASVPFFSWMLSAGVWSLIALVVNESAASSPRPYGSRSVDLVAEARGGSAHAPRL